MKKKVLLKSQEGEVIGSVNVQVEYIKAKWNKIKEKIEFPVANFSSCEVNITKNPN